MREKTKKRVTLMGDRYHKTEDGIIWQEIVKFRATGSLWDFKTNKPYPMPDIKEVTKEEFYDIYDHPYNTEQI